MLLDSDGDAVFVYTPPSLRTAGRSKARDPRHAARLYKRAEADETGRWQAFHFTSHDNPHISTEALADITTDMSRMAYEQEILAEDRDENPMALWKRKDIDDNRVTKFPDLERVIVGVDPTATQAGDETGIVVAGKAGEHYYVLDDASLHASPQGWAAAVVAAYSKARGDRIVAEANNGGEMVLATIRTVDQHVPVNLIHATRGKATRAEPVVAIYEQGRVHHVGEFPTMETEMLMWAPGDASPNRMDALVWAITELMTGGGGWTYQ
jgi:phage terminase large subunit-like protein